MWWSNMWSWFISWIMWKANPQQWPLILHNVSRSMLIFKGEFKYKYSVILVWGGEWVIWFFFLLILFKMQLIHTIPHFCYLNLEFWLEETLSSCQMKHFGLINSWPLLSILIVVMEFTNVTFHLKQWCILSHTPEYSSILLDSRSTG